MALRPANFRRWWLGAFLVGAAVVAGAVIFRRALVGAATRVALERAGAANVRLHVARATPWAVELAGVTGQWAFGRFAAEGVALTRARWWQPSLGVVRVRGLTVPVRTAEAVARWQAARAEPDAGVAAGGASGGAGVPLEALSVDGRLVLETDGLAERAVAVEFAARWDGAAGWSGTARAEAPGLVLTVAGTYDQATGAADFHATEAIDLGRWRDVLGAAGIWPEAAQGWEVAGQMTGTTEGRRVGGRWETKGTLRLAGGSAADPAGGLKATGVTADFRFTDFGEFVCEPGVVRIDEVRAGQLRLARVETELAFQGPERMAVSWVRAEALGGKVGVESFAWAADQPELALALTVAGLDVEQMLALVQGVPARASGRVDGRIPLRFDGRRVRLGTGWLELSPEAPAEVQLQAEGLLTGGADPKSPRYAVLKKIETGLLRLRVNRLRLDVRPPNALPGRSATLHLEGAPMDPEVKAPVTLDLNVNGPIEQLINLGLDRRTTLGTKP